MAGWVVPNISNNRTLEYSVKEWANKYKYILSLCQNKRTVVQAGGNIGVFPYHLSFYFDKVITYEPIYKNYEALVLNTTIRDNITIFNAGLGSRISAAKIKAEQPNNSGAIQLEYTEEIGSIHTTSLDLQDIKDLDLLWLDVEGFEVEALKGALDTINKNKPIIVVENNGLIPEFPSSLEGSIAFREWVESLGYKYINRIMRDDIFIPRELQ